VARHEFGALAGIDQDGAAVSQYAPHLFGADFWGFLVRLSKRCLIDAALRGRHIDAWRYHDCRRERCRPRSHQCSRQHLNHPLYVPH
jgi:hypothetical protein